MDIQWIFVGQYATIEVVGDISEKYPRNFSPRERATPTDQEPYGEQELEKF